MSVVYAELTPTEFRQRLAEAPIAYLPLGTLEWHGEHLPIGSDGMQSAGFFQLLAEEVGGIVLPMLFLVPDRRQVVEGRELYGMDICHAGDAAQSYETQQLDGSAYWVPDDTFGVILDATLKQLARAGFRIVVAHGHGPSISYYRDHAQEWQERYGIECLVCWGGEHDREGLGIQVDHAAMNETSLMMALHPDLVHMAYLPADLAQWPVAVGGRDPRVHASPELGQRALALNVEQMAGILREMLRRDE